MKIENILVLTIAAQIALNIPECEIQKLNKFSYFVMRVFGRAAISFSNVALHTKSLPTPRLKHVDYNHHCSFPLKTEKPGQYLNILR